MARHGSSSLVDSAIASPVIGTLADHTSLQIALVPLVALPALSWLMFRGLLELRKAMPARYRG